MEHIDRMLPDLYKAAVEGKPDDYYAALRRLESYKASGRDDESDDDDYYEVLRQMEAKGVGFQVTPNGNTVLHVAALHGQKHFVESLLGREDTYPMLLAKNHKNRTVLHCAAEKGHAEIVSVIINVTEKEPEPRVGVMRELIRMTDIVGDTALHKAVRMGHVEVVKLLVQEDREFEYPPNDAGETPIYIAAESNGRDPLLETYGECLKEMLNTFEKPSYGGPFGRNAIHAAVLSGDIECMSLLLEKEICLCEMKDDFGWTPLHYAARINDWGATYTILEAKSSAAYIRAGRGDDWTTVFHIAAKEGHVGIMKCISRRCPDCWEMVNSKGQNALHETIQSGEKEVFKYIKKCNQLDNLASEGDNDGNTPIHLLPIYEDYWADEFVHNLLRKDNKKQLVFNKQHQNPTDIYMERHGNPFKIRNDPNDEHYYRVYGRYGQRVDLAKKSRKKISTTKKDFDINDMVDNLVRSSETDIIVATLIATITFAAGFTVPGGYNSNVDSEQAGKAILIRNAAFKAFVVTDVVAFICSMLAVFNYGSLVAEAASPYRDIYKIVKLSFLAKDVMVFASLGVGVAFLCGMYAALEPSLPLAITVLALGAAIPILAYCCDKMTCLTRSTLMKIFNV